MANRILSIDGTQKSETVNRQIYVDVDMVSRPVQYDRPDIGKYYKLSEGVSWTDICKLVGKEESEIRESDMEIAIGEGKAVKTKNGYDKDLRIYFKKTESPFVIEKLVNVAAVQNSLKNIFTWIPGERVINPEFGSKLRKLLYEQITKITEERIVAEIKGSVSRWEPRVEILQIINASDIEDTEDNIIRLDIKYRIKGLEDIYTYTYEQNNSK